MQPRPFHGFLPAMNNHATGKDKWLGHLAMLLFAVLIAGSFSIGDQAAPHIAPAALNALRFFLAALMMGGIAYAVTGKVPGWPQSPWRFVILGGLMAIYFVLMFVALRITGPVSTGAVFTLIPLMSAGFGWLFLRQKTRPVVMVSLLVAAAGAIWVIFRGDINAILGFEVGRGEAIFFIGCACHAAYAPLVRKFNRGEPTVAYSFYTLAAVCIWVTLAGLPDIAATDWAGLPAIVWIAIAYLFIFTTALTFFLLQFAALRLPASKVLAYGYLTPAFVIVLEGLIGHGWVNASVLAGALVTAGALLVLAFAPDG
ncbi:MAG: DMT family transporter [Phyllobacteriaceae bacterium]|nr:DMT family transporter [Phyllobacteriaceae bacterium]